MGDFDTKVFFPSPGTGTNAKLPSEDLAPIAVRLCELISISASPLRHSKESFEFPGIEKRTSSPDFHPAGVRIADGHYTVNSNTDMERLGLWTKTKWPE